MNNENGRDLEGNGHDLTEELFQNVIGQTDETRTPVRIANVPAETRNGHGIIQELYQMLLEGRTKTRGISSRTDNVPAEIRTDHLPNISIQPYHYAKPLSTELFT